MKIFKLERTQTLPLNLEQAWEFFSNPLNLSQITPPSLGLRIKGRYEGGIYNGMMIEYTVKPLAGLPMDWVSEIKHVQKPFIFVDQQIAGPYKFWYHQHIFKVNGEGVETIDRVYYALPGGPLAHLLNDLMIKGRLDEIFAYRKKVLERKFSGR